MIVLGIILGFAAIAGLTALNLLYYRARAAMTQAERDECDQAFREDNRVW